MLTPEREDARQCEVAEASSALAVVCPVYTYDRQGNYASSILRMTRFDLGSAQLQRTGEATAPIVPTSVPSHLTLSPDGRVAVYWSFAPVGPVQGDAHERTLLAAAVDDGRVLFTERTLTQGVGGTSAAALPDERGVRVADWVEGGGRLRWLRPDGTVARRWDLDEAPRSLHATARADRAWVVGYQNAMLVRIE